MTFDNLFDQLRRGPWNNDPNEIPQEGRVGGGNVEPSGWLADGSVSADVIQANAVTAAKITAGAVTADKISAGAIDASKIAAGSITADKIATNAVTADKISANSVGTDKIAANSITTSKIAAGSITGNEIAANAVTASKIAADSVGTSELVALSVTADEIASNAVTTNKVLAGNITSSRIALTVSGKNFGANFGSQGAPGLYFDSNSDTGVYGSASQMTLGLNNAPRIAISSGQITYWGSLMPGISGTNIGTSGTHPAIVYATLFVNLSDASRKTDVEDSPLGLDFIRSLRPRAYRWKETEDTQAIEAAAVDEAALNAELAPYVDYLRLSLEDRDDPDVEAGVEIARDEINAITRRHVEPVEAAMRAKRPGRRQHYGLIAQEVKEALDAAGVDAGFWQEDAEGVQSLAYTGLIAPLIKAVQELSVRVEELESAVRK